jgi:distribution and morphology protein 31
VLQLYISDLSYVNNALVRPIVAFLNANRTLIPIKCRVEMPMSEFDGSWTTYDTGLLEALSVQVYKALAFHIHHANEKRAKQVGMWSLQLTARGVLKALQAWNEQVSMAV